MKHILANAALFLAVVLAPAFLWYIGGAFTYMNLLWPGTDIRGAMAIMTAVWGVMAAVAAF